MNLRIHPISVIFIGLFVCSIGFNILMLDENRRLIYKIQKLEAGPARGLFLEPKIENPPIEDQELKELMKKILEKMIKERIV